MKFSKILFWAAWGIFNLFGFTKLQNSPGNVDFSVWLGFLIVGNLVFYVGNIFFLRNLVQEQEIRNRRKKAFFIAILTCSGMVAGIILGEASFRIIRGIQKKGFPGYSIPDATIGWVSTPRLVVQSDIPGFGSVHYSTEDHGFRKFGRLDSKRKVLVIGDSFTQAVQVSNGLCYYDFLQKEFPEWEFFVCGAGGYATLQEYMIIDRYFDVICPDIIIWQFCGNDFIGNLFEIQKDSFKFQPCEIMPFWEMGNISYRFSQSTPFGIEKFARYFELAKFIVFSYDLCLEKIDPHLSIEFRLDPQVLEKSFEVTRQIFQMARKRAGNGKVITFSVDQNEKLSEICGQNISNIPGVRDELQKAEQAGKKTTGLPYDGHWNACGHEIAGRHLGRNLRKMGFLQ